jgi:FMN phosphatase YigB (HAD superfamily)
VFPPLWANLQSRIGTFARFVAPGQALVVESCPAACGWARSAGAHAVWIGPPEREGITDEVVSALAGLADALINVPR